MFGSRGAGINPCICSLWVGDGTISVSGPHWYLRWWLGTGPSCTQQKTQVTELSRFPPAILHQLQFSQRLKVLLNIGFHELHHQHEWTPRQLYVHCLVAFQNPLWPFLRLWAASLWSNTTPTSSADPPQHFISSCLCTLYHFGVKNG